MGQRTLYALGTKHSCSCVAAARRPPQTSQANTADQAVVTPCKYRTMLKCITATNVRMGLDTNVRLGTGRDCSAVDCLMLRLYICISIQL